jgi:hypothetical protein
VKLAGIITACVLLLSPCFANEEVVEIGNVQVARSLSGNVTDPTGASISGVQVIEVAADWHTTRRSTVTDAQGQWSLPPVANQKVYYIRLVKGRGFNEVRFRVRLDKRKGKVLGVKLPLA